MRLEDCSTVYLVKESERSNVTLVTVGKNDEFHMLKRYRDTFIRKTFEHLQQVSSPYFPHFEEIWEEDGWLCVLEEYVAGQTLEEFCQERTLSGQEYRSIGLQVCDAISVLHNLDTPILHRDLKPQNILIDKSQQIHVIDFDAAREFKANQDKDTVLLGTKEYASPEQYGFSQTDKRSDVYSLGIVLSEILKKCDVSDRAKKRVEAVLSRATRFDPKERYEDAAALKVAFERATRTAQNMMQYAVPAAALLLFAAMIGFFTIGSGQVQPTEAPKLIPTEAASPTETVAVISPTLTPTPTTTPTPTIIPTEEYRIDFPALINEVATKKAALNNYQELYNLPLMEKPEDHGFYSGSQETVYGRDFRVLRFYQGQPSAIECSSFKYSEKDLVEIYLEKYNDDLSTEAKTTVPAEFISWTNECSLVVSEEYFAGLQPGGYLFTVVFMNENGDGCEDSWYLIVHSADEDYEKYLAWPSRSLLYYSSEQCNDVRIFLNNSSSAIESVSLNGKSLEKSDFSIGKNGKEVIIEGAGLEKYSGEKSLVFEVIQENGCRVTVRIVFLKQFNEGESI